MAVINFDNVSKFNVNKNEKELICSNKPLLHEIEKVYGYGTVVDIIHAYLFKFQASLSIKDEYKLDASQMALCANNMIPFLRALTISEIVMMFKRFLSGEFGRFYGNIDIMVLGEWVRQFKRKRGELILDNPDVRKYIVKRDQNFNEDKASWRDEETKNP